MKLVVFMPMIIFMAFFLLLVGGFLLLILKIINKTKNSYWKGKVTDKLYNAVEEDSDSNARTSFYTLVVKTDEGITRKIAVRKEMYDSCKVGDTLEKPLGKLNPVKI
jgi:ABC-type Na+ efflux pump permease subunit